jgi:hypothetical protein
MRTFQIVPRVDEAREFVEIATDFANPLDLVREGISNAMDARARDIMVSFSVEKEYGESIAVITLADDGDGMTESGLQSFFDLGNSTRRGDATKIGEKGHGTKVYLNSSRVEIWTNNGATAFNAVMNEPKKQLHGGLVPEVTVREVSLGEVPKGTKIEIRGYNNNRRDRFTHAILRDHVLWFSKFGSIESGLGRVLSQRPVLRLKGLDRDAAEEIPFGHVFPTESKPFKDLFEEHLIAAPDHFCRRIVREGFLPKHPDIPYSAVFSIEGKYVKYSYNSMLRRPGYAAPKGAYTIQERYGVWLCKDFIPIQRKNDWVSTKGSEYTRLHAFVNCQELSLTANRGSVDNTPSEVLEDLREVVDGLYTEIVESDDWRELEWLEEEAIGYKTTEKEKKDFAWRKKKIATANTARLDHVTLVEPQRESGVYSLFIQLTTLRPDAFPFCVVEYDTHSGIDVIAKGDATTPIHASALFYVEFKHFLERQFNHSFENLRSVVCWDTKTKHGEVVIDITGEERTMAISPAAGPTDYTRYYLEHPKKSLKIEVFVLKDYLRERLKIEFRPRGPEAAS